MTQLEATHHSDTSQGGILIVDDTSDNLHLLSKILSLKGYEVRAVTSGSMALTVVQAAPPEIILLDIRMPQMDGYEVCRRLKADPATRDIPIIFLSALTEIEDKTDAFEVGGIDYITKPFRMAEVIARVKIHLTLRRLQEKLQQQNDYFQKEIWKYQKYQQMVGADKQGELQVSPAIAPPLQNVPHNFAQHVEEASLLLINLVNSTELVSCLSALEWIQLLNQFFVRVDDLRSQYDLEQIRISGTELLLAAGVLSPKANHAEPLADFAIALTTSLSSNKPTHGQSLQLQIAIHTGAVIVGVVGTQTPSCDLWGETIDQVKQIQNYGIPGCIQVSSRSQQLLQGRYFLEERGRIEVNTSGVVPTFWLKGKRG